MAQLVDTSLSLHANIRLGQTEVDSFVYLRFKLPNIGALYLLLIFVNLLAVGIGIICEGGIAPLKREINDPRYDKQPRQVPPPPERREPLREPQPEPSHEPDESSNSSEQEVPVIF